MDTTFRFLPAYQSVDIWDCIASHCGRTTLRELSTGMKVLTDPSQRHLFKNLSYKNNFLRFRSLASSSRLASYVHSLVFSAENLEDGDIEGPLNDSDITHPGALLPEYLPKFTGLQSLHLKYILVTESAMTSISALGSLRRLKFDHIVLKCSLTPPVPLNLREFSCEIDIIEEYKESPSHPDLGPDPLFITENLKDLTIKPTFSQELTNFFYNALIIHPHHNQLVTLEVELSTKVYDAFVKLLDASPLLRKLTIVGELEGRSNPPVMCVIDILKATRTMCPQLQDLTCPPIFAEIFAFQRAIRCFSMEDPYDYCIDFPIFDVATALTFVDGSIENLNLPRMETKEAMVLLLTLHRYFPHLGSLRLIVNDSTVNYTYDWTVDAQTIEDPDDMEECWDQFNLCYDDYDTFDEFDSDDDDGSDVADNHTEDDENEPTSEVGSGDENGDRNERTPYMRGDDDDRDDGAPESSSDDDADEGQTQYQPKPVLRFDRGYLRLLALLALGDIELPANLTDLYIPQARQFKRLRYLRDHELMLMYHFATNPKLRNLRRLTFGMYNAYNESWRKHPNGQWKKERFFYEMDGKEFLGTAILVPIHDQDSDELKYSPATIVDVIELPHAILVQDA